MALFHSRIEAAHGLAQPLAFLKAENPLVLGLANGGVPIAEVIAQALDAPLDVLLIERLTAPKNPNHVVGAVDEHGRISMIRSTARWHHLTSQQMVDPARELFRELQRRRGRIRSVLPEMDVRDRTVIIIGQGVITGAKMLGAVASVRDRGARKVVVAAPAGAGEATWQLHEAADLVVIPHRPAKHRTIADFYDESHDVTEAMVYAIVERWVRSHAPQQLGVKTLIMKPTNEEGQLLACEIDLPPGASRGSGPYPAVVFAHGFESDGRSPGILPVSQRLAKRSIIGIRPDFTGHGRSEGDPVEGSTQRMYNDLKIIYNNIRQLHEVDLERLALVGSGTGAMLALNLAVEDPSVKAVVACGPMCGKEMEAAAHVKAPTLLIYAEQDAAYARTDPDLKSRLPSTHEVLEIQDAARLFTDAISREMMVGATVDWLVDHLVPSAGSCPSPSSSAPE